jgi:predicted DNA-binding transcriptional regulator AlpA
MRPTPPPQGSVDSRVLATPSPFVTVPEVAALLRVPRSWVYEQTRQVGAEAIPCYRAGKRLVFDAGEVLAWFRQTYRHRLLPGDRRRRVPLPHGGSQRGRSPGMTRVSGNGPSPVAFPVPEETRNA